MTEKEQRNYEVLSKIGKWLCKFGTVDLKKDTPKIRWLHPLGFLSIVIIGVFIPFHCMVSREKVQDEYPDFLKHTILF